MTMTTTTRKRRKRKEILEREVDFDDAASSPPDIGIALVSYQENRGQSNF
jgi:hypothetical protein